MTKPLKVWNTPKLEAVNIEKTLTGPYQWNAEFFVAANSVGPTFNNPQFTGGPSGINPVITS